MKITADKGENLRIDYRVPNKDYTNLVNEATSDSGNGPFDTTNVASEDTVWLPLNSVVMGIKQI